MSFLDVALQSKEYQYIWFIKLTETHGLDAANKFIEILRQVPNLATAAGHHNQQPQKKHNPLIPSQADLFLDNILNTNKDVMAPTNIQQPTMHHQSQNASVSNGNALLACQSGGKSLLDNVDLFGNLSSSLQNDIPLIGSNSSASSSQQSVPLYRRQAGQNYQNSTTSSSNAQSIASSTPDLLDNHLQQSLFDALDNKLHPNSSSMMFGGQNPSQFGAGDHSNGFQGFPSIHNLAAGLMQQQQQQQQHQQQHNLNSREFWHQLQQQQHQHQQQHLHEGRGNSATSTVEELLNRQNQTYASVLSQAGSKSGASKDGSGANDGSGGSGGVPFAALRDLGRKSNGFYNYFQ